MSISTITERIKTTCKLLTKHCKIYTKFNLVNLIIGILLTWGGIQLGSLIGDSVEKIRYLTYVDNSTLIKIGAYMLGIMIVGWIYYSFIFLGNFFITEKIFKEGKEPNLKEIWVYIKNNFVNKIKVDFWMFLIYLGLGISWLIIGAVLFFLLIKTGLAPQGLVIIGLLIFAILTLIYVSIIYYLSYYYVFENRKFGFKDFIKSCEVTKGHRWGILGNLIVLMIIILILNYILGKILILIPNIYVIIPIKTIWMILTNLLFLIYFYLYYKHITTEK